MNRARISVMIAYNGGMTNNVIRVAAESPKIIVLANGIQIGDLPPSPVAMGINPKIVVTEVKIIGRKRTLPAFKIARHLL